MLMAVRHAATLAIFFCIVGTLSAADEILSREAVAKRAKVATALVEAKPAYGTSFCVHAAGLFVTNDHVVQQGPQEVKLVLNAGLKTQKVLKA